MYGFAIYRCPFLCLNMNNALTVQKMVKMKKEKNDVIVINVKNEIASESVFIKSIMKPS